MSPKIEGWLLAGDRDGQHGVVDTNLDQDLAAEVARRTDLPGSLPSEFRTTDLSAFGCFRHGERFVLYEIARDPSATRAGMARSGAIVLSVDEVMSVDDPVQLLVAVRSIRQEGAPDREKDDSWGPIPRCVPLLSRLVDGPAMVSSELETGNIMRSVWASLPQTLRPDLGARLCFSEEDLPKHADITLGFMPDGLRWDCSDEVWVADPCLQTGVDVQTTSLANLLADGGARSLEVFANENGLRLSSFHDLHLLDRIKPATNGDPAPDEILKSLRYVLSLATEPGECELIDNLAGRIAARQREWLADEVAAFRNLELRKKTPLAIAVTKWTDAQLSGEGAELVPLTSEIWGSGAREWWSAAIEGSLRSHRGHYPRHLLASFLEKVADAEEDQSGFAAAIADGGDTDADLAEIAVASFSTRVAVIADRLDPERFPRTVLASRLAGSAQIATVVEVGRTIESKVARAVYFQELVDRATPDLVPSLVILDADDDMTDHMLSRSTNDPMAFEEIDLGEARSQKFLAKVISQDVMPKEALLGHLERLMGIIIEGGKLETDLADTLVATEDLVLPRSSVREMVWGVLPEGVRDVMLLRAALEWLSNLASGEVYEIEDALKATLRSSALSNARAEVLRVADLTTWAALAGLESRPGYQYRQRLLEILETGTAQSLEDVVAMAEVVRRKNPGSVASTIVTRHRGRRDLIPAWPILRPVLGYFDRWLLPDAKVERSDWDRALEKILADLYPEGPTQEGIWERAGGSASDVTMARSGGDGWRRAVKLVGSGARVSRKTLLREALEDHPRNDQLAFLRDNRPQ